MKMNRNNNMVLSGIARAQAGVVHHFGVIAVTA
jgi:hypothetical protein